MLKTTVDIFQKQSGYIFLHFKRRNNLISCSVPLQLYLVITRSPHTRPDPVTAIVFALKSSAMYSCLNIFDENNHYSIEQKLNTRTHTVIPASVEMINYYFRQISSFCCCNVLMYYVVLITSGTDISSTDIWSTDIWSTDISSTTVYQRTGQLQAYIQLLFQQINHYFHPFQLILTLYIIPFINPTSTDTMIIQHIQLASIVA